MADEAHPNPRAAGSMACVNCAKAKSKCLPGPTQHLCQRCNRLKKHCFPQTPAPKRVRKERRKRTSRVATLERRVEELTSRLSSDHRSGDINSTPISESDLELGNGDVDGEDEPTDEHTQPIPASPAAGNVHHETHEPVAAALLDLSHGSSFRTNLPHPAAAPALEPGEAPRVQPDPADYTRRTDEPNDLASRYRNQMQNKFPFVIIPPELLNADGRKQRPFLWRTVKLVTMDQHDAKCAGLADQLLRDIVEAAILAPDRGIDLLQGLLVLVAWYHWNLDKFQLRNLLFLARSLCEALGFTGDVSLQDSSLGVIDQARAYCGWYYLSTLFFGLTSRLTAASASACSPLVISQSRMVLRSSTGHREPSDNLVLALVQIQQLAQSVLSVRASRELQGVRDLPLAVVADGFRRQLEKLSDSLLEEFETGEQRECVRAHLSVVNIMIYEIAVPEHPLPLWARQQDMSHIDSTWSALDIQANDAQARAQLLRRCLISARFFLATHPIDPRDTPTSYPAVMATLYGYQLCLRLVSLRGVSGWDPSATGRELDFGPLLERTLGVGDARHTLRRDIDVVSQRLKQALTNADGGKVDVRDGAGVAEGDIRETSGPDAGNVKPGNSKGASNSGQRADQPDRTTATTPGVGDSPHAPQMQETPWPILHRVNPPPPEDPRAPPIPTFGGTFPQIALWPRFL